MSNAPQDSPVTPSAPSAALRLAKPSRTRTAAGLVLLGCLAILLLSAWLKPDPRGYGTHAQLGTGPCGALVMTGYPCPTCGMTTAFAHTVRGQWLRAFWVQPAGFVLALGTLVATGVAVWTVICGRWPRPRLPFVTPYRLFLGLLVLFLAAWAFKIVVGLVDGTLPFR